MKPQERTRAIVGARVEMALKMVLVVVADAMLEDRETCWLSVETIAKRASLCERQTRDVLASAEQRGIIRRWSGEHKSRDIAIVWEALAAAAAPGPSTRGRKPKAPPKVETISTVPEIISGVEGGNDFHPDRKPFPRQPEMVSTPTGNDCPLSGKEADLKREEKQECAPLRGAGGPPPEPPARRASAANMDTPFRRRVTDAFGDAFREVFGVRYPWVFKGREHDGHRANVWIDAAQIRESDPRQGLDRLHSAALNYCRAVKAGKVYPYAERANTRRFTTGIAEWLQPASDAMGAPPRLFGRSGAQSAVNEELNRLILGPSAHQRIVVET